MTIALNGASVDTGPVAPAISAPRAQASLLAALGRPDPAAAARLQLPSAVGASATLIALPPGVPAAPKPLLRTPSSLLAAQFIGQDIGLTASDLEIFAVRQNPSQANVPLDEGDDYLAALRIARGDNPTAQQVNAAVTTNQSTETIQAATREALARAKATQAGIADSQLRGGVAAFAAGLPALTLPLLRRISIASVNGVGAYGFALARSATLRAPNEQAS